MKNTIMKILPILMASMAPARVFAASGLREDSSIFVWGFLGFCALIVVAQIMHAVLIHFISTKGFAKEETKQRFRATICRCIYESDRYKGREGRERVLENLNIVDKTK
jgi:hypothetical protein